MTRIDFHSNVGNQLDYACRLTRKALNAGCRIVVRHQDAEQLAAFDELLWSFSETDFLPHVTMQNSLAPHTPVLLSLEQDVDEVTDPGAALRDDEILLNEILLNLSGQVPRDFARFGRLLEVVPADPDATQAGRARYREYQNLGYSLNHINAK